MNSIKPEDIIFLAASLFLTVAILVISSRYAASLNNKLDEQGNIRRLKEKIGKETDKTKPSWELATATLESYFNKNLSQVSAIFWLSVAVMLVGFGIIVFGVIISIKNPTPNASLPAIIAVVAGILTEFIGATFLFIFKSTMEQAIVYTKTLERINTVGMAIQILDTLPDNAEERNLKHETKSSLVKLLMRISYQNEHPAQE